MSIIHLEWATVIIYRNSLFGIIELTNYCLFDGIISCLAVYSTLYYCLIYNKVYSEHYTWGISNKVTAFRFKNTDYSIFGFHGKSDECIFSLSCS